MKRKFHQTYFLLVLIATTLYAKIAERMENIGHWFFDLSLYQGKAGQVDFDCETEHADGVIRCREVDSNGLYRVAEIAFRIPNRWALTGGRRPCGMLLMDLHSQIQLTGRNPINIQWFTQTQRRTTQPAFDLYSVLNNPRVLRRTERLARFHRLLIRWFPTPVVKSYDPREHTDMIIKRF